MAEPVKVPKEEFEAVIRMLLNTPPTPRVDYTAQNRSRRPGNVAPPTSVLAQQCWPPCVKPSLTV
jgi:hypothetical protein